MTDLSATSYCDMVELETLCWWREGAVVHFNVGKIVADIKILNFFECTSSDGG